MNLMYQTPPPHTQVMKAGGFVLKQTNQELLIFGVLSVLLTVMLVDIHKALAMAAWLMLGSLASIGLPVLTLRGGGATSTSVRAT